MTLPRPWLPRPHARAWGICSSKSSKSSFTDRSSPCPRPARGMCNCMSSSSWPSSRTAASARGASVAGARISTPQFFAARRLEGPLTYRPSENTAEHRCPHAGGATIRGFSVRRVGDPLPAREGGRGRRTRPPAPRFAADRAREASFMHLLSATAPFSNPSLARVLCSSKSSCCRSGFSRPERRRGP